MEEIRKDIEEMNGSVSEIRKDIEEMNGSISEIERYTDKMLEEIEKMKEAERVVYKMLEDLGFDTKIIIDFNEDQLVALKLFLQQFTTTNI